MLTEQPILKISEYVSQILENEPLAGVSLGATDRERTLHTAAYGYSELASQSPLRTDHLMQIGSIGKSFTAIILLQLAEEGLLDLHAPLTDVLPWLQIPSPYPPITIHHLLTHTAGIIGGMDESPSQAGEALTLKRLGPGGPPGERYHYSNSGYKVLGLVVEKLTRKRYSEVVRERIFEPLGMHQTVGEIRHTDRARHSVGYSPFPPDRPIVRPFTDKSALQPATWFETATADGCITSTPGDMAIYTRALLNGFSTLLSTESFDRMRAPHIPIPDTPGFHYGYGLNVVEENGQWKLMHGGGMVGFFCYLVADMAAGMGAIVLMNGPGPSYALSRFVTDSFRSGVSEEALPEIPPLWDFFKVEDAETFAGAYRYGDRLVTLHPEKEALVWVEEDVRLALRIPDVFFAHHPILDSAFMRFQRNDLGDVIGFAHGPDWYVREGVEEDWGAPPERWNAYPGRYISYNPWYGGFRVFIRRGDLVLAHFSEEEDPLVELTPGLFRIGEDEASPERLQFEEVVDGKALVASFSGTAYHRD